MQAFRFTGAGQIEIIRAEGGNRGERAIVLLPVEEIRIGDRALVEGWRLGVDGDELIGIPEREGVQEHAVDNRKKRCVGPDPEGECKDGDGGEARALPENSQSKLDILAKIFHVTPRAK